MHKQNVFVVTGRQIIDGIPRGAIETVVVCADGDKGVRRLLSQQRPALGITTITGFVTLENRLKKIKNTLAGDDIEWGVLVDPRLEVEARAGGVG